MSDEKKDLLKVESTIKKMQDSPLLGKVKNLLRGVLVDVSYSMAESVGSDYESGQSLSRHDVVQKVMKDTVEPMGLRIFWFSHGFGQAEDGMLPDPHSGTDMTGAFKRMKDLGIKHIVLLTDGRPDEEASALQEGKDCQFDIIYIGPKPVPNFLLKLGKLKGNSFQDVDMIKSGAGKELGSKIKALLGDKSSGTFYGI